MKKIKLTEKELTNLVHKIIKEDLYINAAPVSYDDVMDKVVTYGESGEQNTERGLKGLTKELIDMIDGYLDTPIA